MTVSALGGVTPFIQQTVMKTDLIEIRENQTLNIGFKLFLSDKIYVSHLFLATFWIVNDLDRFQDDKAQRERETRERERLGERERERERERGRERERNKN